MARDELETIISTGQKPRLFLIERDGSAMTVKEILAAADFQAIAEQSTTRIAKKEDSVVTLWFDTEPKSYREIRITTKISDHMKAKVFDGMDKQRELELNRLRTLNSVGDPKWRELETREQQEEDEMKQLLKKYGAFPDG
jgi:hypothetical protein